MRNEARLPDHFGREVLAELHARLRHLCRRHVDHAELHRAPVLDLALQAHERLRLEAGGGEPLVLAFRVRAAEAHEMHAGVSGHVVAHALRVRRVEHRGQDFHIAALEHQAAVRGAGGLAVRLVVRNGRGHEAEALEERARFVQVGDKMGDVVEDEVPRFWSLMFSNHHFSPRPSDLLITSFMISLVPP
jgi:hypothetical protein